MGASSTPAGRVAIDTLFSSGLGEQGEALSPGTDDPHYINDATGEPVLAMQNHPAWMGNSSDSQWIGVTAQGEENVAAGQYIFSTTFDLAGYDSTTAVITLMIGVDNTLHDVRFNGASRGFSTAGFSSLNGPFTIDSGFVAGDNTIEFVFTNDGSAPNPMGLRIKAEGTAVPVLEQTELSSNANTYYFRKQFMYQPYPASYVTLKLDSIVDDGAVFYLNGQEVYRVNMSGGDVTYQTEALSEIDNPEFTGPVIIPSGYLVSGLNTLAVEVHHASASEDMLFAANLIAIEAPVPSTEPLKLAINEITSAMIEPMSIELHNYGDESIDITGLVLD